MIKQSLVWFIPDLSVIDIYSSWLYGNWVIELLVNGTILIFI